MADKKQSVKKNLTSKLVAILGGIGAVKRGGYNDHFKYAFHSEADIAALIRPKLAEQGLALITSVKSIESRDRVNSKGNTETLVTVLTEHTLQDGDESIVFCGAGMGIDAGDKGVYKAITGAFKYALMKLFLISDSVDPEGDSAGDKGREAKPASNATSGSRHSRTADYDQNTSASKPGATSEDLAKLNQLLKETKMTQTFVLAQLQSKGLADGSEETVADLKPGVLVRVLKSFDRLRALWDEEHGGKGATSSEKPAAAAEKKEPAAGTSKADVKKAAAKEQKGGKAKPGDGENTGTTRTREGDQTRDLRQPVQSAISPQDFLEQEGVEKWEEVAIHFGKQKGTKLGLLSAKDLKWWITNYAPKQFKGKWQDPDLLLDAALCVAHLKLAEAEAGA